jgi:DNA-binding transcriptional MerR regulator
MDTTTTSAKGPIPDKLFYKATEVCQITDTQPYVLRFWESEFPQLASEKNRSGQKVYRRQDIELILRIKKLLYQEEYTIAGARKVIEGELGTTVEAHGAKHSGKRPAPPEPKDVAHGAPPAAHEPAPLFGESRPEAPAPAPSATDGDEPRYRALYEESLSTLDALKSDLAAAATERDRLKDRQRRVLSGLQAALES